MAEDISKNSRGEQFQDVAVATSKQILKSQIDNVTPNVLNITNRIVELEDKQRSLVSRDKEISRKLEDSERNIKSENKALEILNKALQKQERKLNRKNKGLRESVSLKKDQRQIGIDALESIIRDRRKEIDIIGKDMGALRVEREDNFSVSEKAKEELVELKAQLGKQSILLKQAEKGINKEINKEKGLVKQSSLLENLNKAEAKVKIKLKNVNDTGAKMRDIEMRQQKLRDALIEAKRIIEKGPNEKNRLKKELSSKTKEISGVVKNLYSLFKEKEKLRNSKKGPDEEKIKDNQDRIEEMRNVLTGLNLELRSIMEQQVAQERKVNSAKQEKNSIPLKQANLARELFAMKLRLVAAGKDVRAANEQLSSARQRYDKSASTFSVAQPKSSTSSKGPAPQPPGIQLGLESPKGPEPQRNRQPRGVRPGQAPPPPPIVQPTGQRPVRAAPPPPPQGASSVGSAQPSAIQTTSASRSEGARKGPAATQPPLLQPAGARPVRAAPPPPPLARPTGSVQPGVMPPAPPLNLSGGSRPLGAASVQPNNAKYGGVRPGQATPPPPPPPTRDASIVGTAQPSLAQPTGSVQPGVIPPAPPLNLAGGSRPLGAASVPNNAKSGGLRPGQAAPPTLPRGASNVGTAQPASDSRNAFLKEILSHGGVGNLKKSQPQAKPIKGGMSAILEGIRSTSIGDLKKVNSAENINQEDKKPNAVPSLEASMSQSISSLITAKSPQITPQINQYPINGVTESASDVDNGSDSWDDDLGEVATKPKEALETGAKLLKQEDIREIMLSSIKARLPQINQYQDDDDVTDNDPWDDDEPGEVASKPKEALEAGAKLLKQGVSSDSGVDDEAMGSHASRITSSSDKSTVKGR